MINLLSIASHKAKYSIDFYPTFAIDGVPIEVWLPRQNPDAEFHLVSAHAGLYCDEDTSLIWGSDLFHRTGMEGLGSYARVLR
ncbi:hypothetical protein PsyrCH409_13215 [Pseudomonas viridiflava]|uniref:hypothetical protein n=1 Tax=Pseudomonas viridiflava TaxID=33069 RepID=UPI000BBDB1C9|nr:hypothetical protein [Pseudomonas viridiflava]PCK91436.1 hypothetical protein PsyrCH409_13215 [Pseudomonas viridiflava]